MRKKKYFKTNKDYFVFYNKFINQLKIYKIKITKDKKILLSYDIM